MKKQLVFITALALLGNAGFAQTKGKAASKPAAKDGKKLPVTADGFTVLPSGLEYKFIKDVPATRATQIGDQVEMNFKSQVGDSILFDSRQMMNNQPVLFTLQKGNYNGDVNEGLVMMSAGDVVTFRTSLDSIAKAGNQLMPWMKAGDKMVYNVEALSVKTPDQVKKEYEEKQAVQINADEKIIQDYFKANKISAEKTASGLYYRITKPGTGPNAKNGQKVTVNYTGRTPNGLPFDSNVDSAFHHVQPFTFSVGQHQVIPGWDEGFTLLNKGAKGTLYIPSRHGYGPQSPTPAIPANSVLIFDVEVTDISGDEVPVQPATPHTHDEHDGHKH